MNWMAEKIVGSSESITSSSDSPRIILLDNAITVEMVSQVWRPLIERRFHQNNDKNDDEEFVATVVPEWQKFVQELKMREKARSKNENTTITTKGPSVSQRCELLFGMEHAPSGDRLMSNAVTNDSDKTNPLGIERFCDFVSSF